MPLILTGGASLNPLPTLFGSSTWGMDNKKEWGEDGQLTRAGSKIRKPPTLYTGGPMPDPLKQVYNIPPMPNAPAGGTTPEARLQALMDGPYKELMPMLLKTYGLNPNDPAATNAAIAKMRAHNDNQPIANAVENAFNNITTGRDIPTSIFQLPTYTPEGMPPPHASH